MMPKTNTTPETSHEDKDRSAEYTQPKISDYGDLVEVGESGAIRCRELRPRARSSPRRDGQAVGDQHVLSAR